MTKVLKEEEREEMLQSMKVVSRYCKDLNCSECPFFNEGVYGNRCKIMSASTPSMLKFNTKTIIVTEVEIL